MKKVLAVLLSLAFCAAAILARDDDDSIVRWRTIVGVITAQGVDNPVGNIHSGTFAWSARSGRAAVNLATGAASFEVDGLVINGSTFTGTAGPITAVTGTLVCNAGLNTQAVLDTPSVPLDARGDAHFSGQMAGIPANCG